MESNNHTKLFIIQFFVHLLFATRYIYINVGGRGVVYSHYSLNMLECLECLSRVRVDNIRLSLVQFLFITRPPHLWKLLTEYISQP